MVTSKGRYSKYLRPISVSFDLLVIICLSTFFFKELNLDRLLYQTYQIIAWASVAYFTEYYKVYRFTTQVQILAKLIKQAIVFLLLVIAFFPFAKETTFSGRAIALFLTSSFLLIIIFKYFLFFNLKKYRIITGSNFRNAVIVGHTPESIQLQELFETRVDYGYNFLGFFSDKKIDPKITGRITEMKAFCQKNQVDEMYCSLSELSNDQVKDLVEFSDLQNITIKFIPDTKVIFSKNLKTDYYELFPVLSLQKTSLDEIETKILKRCFDILFSLFVIIGLLSWLTPILAILIKLESKGTVFFKQGRPGFEEKEFFCYKFRSMKVNEKTETEAQKNDPRVTKIGRFIRKTSIDEMPQFINVLLGEMSVVGPRPHLWSQNKVYGNKIKKYMVRHYVKPGITGLAQVRGFRGEIETDDDMINRIKYDVFYIENWSLILDIKIIVQTVINIFKGEDKAY